MRLDRNNNDEGRGKYALLKLRELERFRQPGPFGGIDDEIAAAIKLLEDEGILDWGEVGTEREFFVIRLRDRFARRALNAYVDAASPTDEEYAHEVALLAARAGEQSPWCKEPD